MTNTPSAHIRTGKLGEDIATEFLIQHDVEIIGRNLRTDFGEIDILGKDDGVMLFVEVKTRRTQKFGFPETAVNARKKKHMTNSAWAYLQKIGALDHAWRIDVISIYLRKNIPPEIEWFKNAITS